MTSQDLWTNKHFLLGESAIKLPAFRSQRDEALSLAQSAQFIFGDNAPDTTIAGTITHMLAMVSALLGEQLSTLWAWMTASQKPVTNARPMSSSAFHSFYPSAAVHQEDQVQAEIDSAQAVFQMGVRQAVVNTHII